MSLITVFSAKQEQENSSQKSQKIMLSFPCTVIWPLCLSSVFCLCMLQCSYCTAVKAFSKHSLNSTVPALFAFGDSLVDTGNNNNLLTLGRCNFPPYGMIFQDRNATGRFSNGRVTIDFYVEALGIKKHVQAYMDQSLQIEDLLTGVSFASAASGYDPLTSEIGIIEGATADAQTYRIKIKSVVGRRRAKCVLRHSIFIVPTGSWDLANTYFALPFRRVKYDVDSYTTLMLKRATRFLEKLYRLGGRKVGINNVPPIGNIPSARTLAGGLTRDSVEHYNEAVKLFNTKLELQIQLLNAKHHEAKLIYIDLYSIMIDIVKNKTRYGFEVIDRGCCGSGLIEAGPLCNQFSRICDPRKFVFWDSNHVTEAVNEIIASKTMEKHFPLFF